MISKITKKKVNSGRWLYRATLSILLFCSSLQAANPGEEGAESVAKYGIKIPDPAPSRGDDEGGGPYEQLRIENVMLVDGLGSPPRGPVDINIVDDKIVSIRASRGSSSAGSNSVSGGIRRIDGTGMTAMPGFIDPHSHIGTPGQGLAEPVTPPEYVFKIWLA